MFKRLSVFLKKKNISYLLFISLGLSIFSGCSQSQENQSYLSMNLSCDPTSLNPHTASMIQTMSVLRQMGEGLMRVSPKGKVEPALASSVEKLDNGKKWRFHLREAYWSDGSRVRAEHFISNWKKMLSGEVIAPFVEQLFIIKNARAIYNGNQDVDSLGVMDVGEDELIVELEEASNYFLYQTSTPIFYPLPDSYDKEMPYLVSCGPFRLASWERSEKIILEKNDRYWDAASVKLKGIIFNEIADPLTQLEMFESGQLDWCGAPTLSIPEESEAYLSEENRLKQSVEAQTTMLVFNCRSGLMKNKKLRLALAYALDRKQLIKYNIFNGQAAYGLVPPGLKKNYPVNFFEEDLFLARHLWEEGCHEEGINPQKPPVLRFIHNNRDNHSRKAQAIQSQWRQNLGIDVHLQPMEWKLLAQALLQGDYDVGGARWLADYPDPMNFLQLYQELNTGRNYPGWYDSSYSALLNKALKATESKEQYLYYQEAEKRLMEKMPITPISHPTSLYIVNPRLKDYYFSPLGYLDFKWAYIDQSVEDYQ